VRSPAARRRYWARSHIGWRRVARAHPNAAHHAIVSLERAGVVRGVVTQNVDGLHRAAGSRLVVDLHGRLDRVVCLDCGGRSTRDSLDARLAAANPGFDRYVARAAPDGDADLPAAWVEQFTVVGCERCGGVLKPDVVFFGENVPPRRVARALRLLADAEVLLVAGTSLSVFSGRRFVITARKQNMPVAIVNRGPTRGDADATVRVDGGVGDVLPALASRSGAGPRSGADRSPTGVG
jgi:NAD-dependent SIR2 family protein deacetylase